MTDQSLEQALATVERDADAAVRAATAAVAEAKRAKAAAASGQLRALRQALDGVVRLTEQAAAAASDVRDGWTFDEQTHFARGAFTKEVLAVAAEQGLDAFESDDRILSYPAIVAVLPSDATVVIDKRKDRRVRPRCWSARCGRCRTSRRSSRPRRSWKPSPRRTTWSSPPAGPNPERR